MPSLKYLQAIKSDLCAFNRKSGQSKQFCVARHSLSFASVACLLFFCLCSQLMSRPLLATPLPLFSLTNSRTQLPPNEPISYYTEVFTFRGFYFHRRRIILPFFLAAVVARPKCERFFRRTNNNPTRPPRETFCVCNA